MTHCFSLTRIGENSPSRLIDIDDAICRYVGDPVDKTLYCRAWFDAIGMCFAGGVSWQRIAEGFADSDLAPVVEFLRTYYTADAWREYGRR